MPKVHLVTFYTEGPPVDAGANLRQVSETFVAQNQRHFASVTAFSPRKLIASDPSWADTLRDRTDEVLSHPGFNDSIRFNPSWLKIGFHAWKPRLLADLAKPGLYDSGDIVLFHDANWAKYPDYLRKLRSQPRWLEKKMKTKDLVLFNDNSAPIESDTKIEVLERFFPFGGYLGLPHVWAGALAFRVDSEATDFLSAWWAASEDTSLLTPITRAPEAPGFLWNSGEQALLSALWHSHTQQNPSFPGELVYLHRSRVIPPPSTALQGVHKVQKTVRRSWRTLLQTLPAPSADR